MTFNKNVGLARTVIFFMCSSCRAEYKFEARVQDILNVLDGKKKLLTGGIFAKEQNDSPCCGSVLRLMIKKEDEERKDLSPQVDEVAHESPQKTKLKNDPPAHSSKRRHSSLSAADSSDDETHKRAKNDTLSSEDEQKENQNQNGSRYEVVSDTDSNYDVQTIKNRLDKHVEKTIKVIEKILTPKISPKKKRASRVRKEGGKVRKPRSLTQEIASTNKMKTRHRSTDKKTSS
jgi:hypothetical protein